LQKDIDLTEGVQRRATELVVGKKGMSYEERLMFLDMTTLETRRIRGDLIKVFEILKGIEDVKEERFFTREKGCTSSHELKLFQPSCRLDSRKYAFTNRVINMWNILPSDVMVFSTVYSFQHKIDAFLDSQGFI
jgi:ribonuclease P/MRP protein subunit RPP40